MDNPFIFKKNEKINEISYMNSSAFNFNFYPKFLPKIKFYSEIGGNKISYESFMGSIWNLENYFCKKQDILYFAILFKDTSKKKHFPFFDFIEIYQYTKKKIIKKKNLIFLNEEIWDLKWKNSKNSKRGVICICSGFKLKIFEVSKIYPAFSKILIALISVNLPGIFQWKISWVNTYLVSGDIYGKIVVYTLHKGLSVLQINRKAHNNSPITALKIFSTKKGSIGYLISGGFDSLVKFWSILDTTKPIFQVNYFNRKIQNFGINSLDFSFPLIFVGLDNGYFSLISFGKNSEINAILNHQGSLSDLVILHDKIFSIGEEGDFVMGDFLLPVKENSFYNNLYFLSQLIFKKTSRVKYNKSFFGVRGSRFSNKILKIGNLSRNKLFVQVACHSNILLFFFFD